MIAQLSQWIWGGPLLIMLCAAGLLLTIRTKGIQFTHFFRCHRLAFTPHHDKAAGDVSQFEAFSTSLAASIGIGSITGMAVALSSGGLGALFWMWLTALLAMPLKYAESFLAIKFRSQDLNHEMCGGPMLYLEKGLKAKWLAILFAAFTALSSLGIGNSVQVQSMAQSLQSTFSIPPLVTGILLSILVGLSILRGIKSIGRITAYLVPIMGLFFAGSALAIIALNIKALPHVLLTVIEQAFTAKAIMLAIMMGAAQGIFSSEAGLGVAGIAASAAQAKDPKKQSLIQMSTVSITTLFICTLMGLVLGVTGVLDQGLSGADIALAAFSQALPFGKILLTFAIIPFGYSTILAWAYFAERALDYLFGIKSIMPFRICFTLFIIMAATANLQLIWDFAYLANGLMAIPNLIGLICLSKKLRV
ncbi:MAG: sodium:alanine symporter family protein [Chlamydiales bacterium]|nr:sodium:alanine symporter family protein [Chlamydiales bacterium]